MGIAEDDAIIREVYPDGGGGACELLIDRSRIYIVQRASKLGVKLNKEVRKKINSENGKQPMKKNKKNLKTEKINDCDESKMMIDPFISTIGRRKI